MENVSYISPLVKSIEKRLALIYPKIVCCVRANGHICNMGNPNNEVTVRQLAEMMTQSDQDTGSLKAELKAILPQVEEMRKRKCERMNQLMKVLEDIQGIKIEIDKLEAYALKEMSERLKQVMELLNYLYSMCSVLGLHFKQTIAEIHPSLGESKSPKHISNSTIEKLGTAIQRLRDVKSSIFGHI